MSFSLKGGGMLSHLLYKLHSHMSYFISRLAKLAISTVGELQPLNHGLLFFLNTK